VEILPGNAGQLALVDVLGAQRPINLGMLDDPNLSPGDWVLIHMGFALEQIDEAGARKALSGLQMMGSPGDGGGLDGGGIRGGNAEGRNVAGIEWEAAADTAHRA
jgi:hydrogenase expression/formation protein HypC